MRSILNDRELVMGVCYYPEHWDQKLWEEDSMPKALIL